MVKGSELYYLIESNIPIFSVISKKYFSNVGIGGIHEHMYGSDKLLSEAEFKNGFEDSGVSVSYLEWKLRCKNPNWLSEKFFQKATLENFTALDVDSEESPKPITINQLYENYRSIYGAHVEPASQTLPTTSQT